MDFSGGLGVELETEAMAREPTANEQALLFAEDAGRFLVEIAPDNYDAFLRAAKDLPVGEIGRVTDTGRIVIKGAQSTLIDLPIEDAKAAWQSTFDW